MPIKYEYYINNIYANVRFVENCIKKKKLMTKTNRRYIYVQNSEPVRRHDSKNQNYPKNKLYVPLSTEIFVQHYNIRLKFSHYAYYIVGDFNRIHIP